MPRSKKKDKYIPTESELVPTDEYATDDSFGESQRKKLSADIRKERLRAHETSIDVLLSKQNALPPLIDIYGQPISLEKYSKLLDAQNKSYIKRLRAAYDRDNLLTPTELKLNYVAPPAGRLTTAKDSKKSRRKGKMGKKGPPGEKSKRESDALREEVRKRGRQAIDSTDKDPDYNPQNDIAEQDETPVKKTNKPRRSPRNNKASSSAGPSTSTADDVIDVEAIPAGPMLLGSQFPSEDEEEEEEGKTPAKGSTKKTKNQKPPPAWWQKGDPWRYDDQPQYSNEAFHALYNGGMKFRSVILNIHGKHVSRTTHLQMKRDAYQVLARAVSKVDTVTRLPIDIHKKFESDKAVIRRKITKYKDRFNHGRSGGPCSPSKLTAKDKIVLAFHNNDYFGSFYGSVSSYLHGLSKLEKIDMEEAKYRLAMKLLNRYANQNIYLQQRQLEYRAMIELRKRKGEVLYDLKNSDVEIIPVRHDDPNLKYCDADTRTDLPCLIPPSAMTYAGRSFSENASPLSVKKDVTPAIGAGRPRRVAQKKLEYQQQEDDSDDEEGEDDLENLEEAENTLDQEAEAEEEDDAYNGDDNYSEDEDNDVAFVIDGEDDYGTAGGAAADGGEENSEEDELPELTTRKKRQQQANETAKKAEKKPFLPKYCSTARKNQTPAKKPPKKKPDSPAGPSPPPPAAKRPANNTVLRKPAPKKAPTPAKVKALYPKDNQDEKRQIKQALEASVKDSRKNYDSDSEDEDTKRAIELSRTEAQSSTVFDQFEHNPEDDPDVAAAKQRSLTQKSATAIAGQLGRKSAGGVKGKSAAAGSSSTDTAAPTPRNMEERLSLQLSEMGDSIKQQLAMLIAERDAKIESTVESTEKAILGRLSSLERKVDDIHKEWNLLKNQLLPKLLKDITNNMVEGISQVIQQTAANPDDIRAQRKKLQQVVQEIPELVQKVVHAAQETVRENGQQHQNNLTEYVRETAEKYQTNLTDSVSSAVEQLCTQLTPELSKILGGPFIDEHVRKLHELLQPEIAKFPAGFYEIGAGETIEHYHARFRAAAAAAALQEFENAGQPLTELKPEEREEQLRRMERLANGEDAENLELAILEDGTGTVINSPGGAPTQVKTVAIVHRNPDAKDDVEPTGSPQPDTPSEEGDPPAAATTPSVNKDISAFMMMPSKRKYDSDEDPESAEPDAEDKGQTAGKDQSDSESVAGSAAGSAVGESPRRSSRCRKSRKITLPGEEPAEKKTTRKTKPKNKAT